MGWSSYARARGVGSVSNQRHRRARRPVDSRSRPRAANIDATCRARNRRALGAGDRKRRQRPVGREDSAIARSNLSRADAAGGRRTLLMHRCPGVSLTCGCAAGANGRTTETTAGSCSRTAATAARPSSTSHTWRPSAAAAPAIRAQWSSLDAADGSRRWRRSLGAGGSVATVLSRHMPASSCRTPDDRGRRAARTAEQQLHASGAHGAGRNAVVVRAAVDWRRGLQEGRGHRRRRGADRSRSKDTGKQRVPGLFLCGEMLDAFGPIGGHNFAWAWATGRAAGMASRATVEPARTPVEPRRAPAEAIESPLMRNSLFAVIALVVASAALNAQAPARLLRLRGLSAAAEGHRRYPRCAAAADR